MAVLPEALYKGMLLICFQSGSVLVTVSDQDKQEIIPLRLNLQIQF